MPAGTVPDTTCSTLNSRSFLQTLHLQDDRFTPTLYSQCFVLKLSKLRCNGIVGLKCLEAHVLCGRHTSTGVIQYAAITPCVSSIFCRVTVLLMMSWRQNCENSTAVFLLSASLLIIIIIIIPGRKAWNSIPIHIRRITSHDTFCRYLKTNLFLIAFLD